MRELAAVWSFTAYTFLLPWAQWGIGMVVLFGVPLAVFKRTRPYAIQGLWVTSYVVGVTTWFLGATISFATFGFLGLFIGIILMGVGVVFVGMLGAGMVMDASDIAFSLFWMSVLTYALRLAAVWLADRDEQDIIIGRQEASVPLRVVPNDPFSTSSPRADGDDDDDDGSSAAERPVGHDRAQCG